MRKLISRLYKRIFKKNNMLRIYATRKENEVHELREEIHELKMELNNTEILLEQAVKERNLYYENLTKAKKEKLASRLDLN